MSGVTITCSQAHECCSCSTEKLTDNDASTYFDSLTSSGRHTAREVWVEIEFSAATEVRCWQALPHASGSGMGVSDMNGGWRGGIIAQAWDGLDWFVVGLPIPGQNHVVAHLKSQVSSSLLSIFSSDVTVTWTRHQTYMNSLEQRGQPAATFVERHTVFKKWRVLNAGSTTWSVPVSDIKAFSDISCSAPISMSGVTITCSQAHECCSCSTEKLTDNDASTYFDSLTSSGGHTAREVWVEIEFSAATEVRCWQALPKVSGSGMGVSDMNGGWRGGIIAQAWDGLDWFVVGLPIPGQHHVLVVGGICASCPDISVFESQTATCLACQANAKSDNGRASCVCNAGFFLQEGSCQMCEQGKYKASAGSGACTDCAAGQQSISAGSTKCQDCVAGRYKASSGTASCQECTAGTYSTSTGATSSDACVGCPANHYSITVGSNTEDDCIDCPSDRPYSQQGSSSEDACNAPCAPGFTGEPGACVRCEDGKYKDAVGNAACQVCTDAQASPDSGRAACVCNAGFFLQEGSCQLCPEGSYTNLEMAATMCSGRFPPVTTMSVQCLSFRVEGF